MKVNRKELSNMLNNLAPAIGAKENDLQQTCYAFKDGVAYAYNDEICISGPSELSELSDFVVQAKEFQTLLNKLHIQEMDVELLEDCLQIKTKRAKAEIKIETEIKMPIDEIQFPKTSSPLPDDFSKALELVLPVVSRDMTKPLSTAIHLAGQCVEASDVDKCARYWLNKDVFKDPVYLPRASAQLASKLHPTTFAITTGWIHFSFDEKYILSCRTYYKGQKFADIGSLLEKQGQALTLPEELPEALERAGVFVQSTDGTETTHEDKYVNIRISDNWCYISGEGAIGKYEEKLRINYDGEEIEFQINVGILLTAIADKQTCEICDGFVKIFSSNFSHLVSFGKPKPKEKKPAPLDDGDVPF